MKINLILLVLSILLSVHPFVSAQAEEANASIYAQSQKLVVPIQDLQSKCVAGLPQSIRNTIGTGFYVLLDEPESLSLWLVTARHVADQHADLLAKARVGSKPDDALYMVLPSVKWVFHPGKTVAGTFPIDVAVMKVLVPADETLAFRYCPGECSQDLKAKVPFLNQLESAPEATDHALFFGYPLGDVIPGEMPPFARSGIVAYSGTNPLMKMKGPLGILPLGDDSVYYVDANSFGGNSGGPIMREPDISNNKIQLFGLVMGSSETRSYTIAASVTRIKETIDYASRQTSFSPERAWFRPPVMFSHFCKL